MSDYIKLDSLKLGEALLLVSQLENDIQETYDGVTDVIGSLDWEVGSKEQIDDMLARAQKILKGQQNSLMEMENAIKAAITRSEEFNSDFVKEASGIITAMIGVISTLYPASKNGMIQTLSGIKNWVSGIEEDSLNGRGIVSIDNEKSQVKRSEEYSGSVKHIVAYRDRNFESNIWPSGYNGASGCGVASLAMVFSSLGLNVTPKDIMSNNSKRNPEYLTSAAYNPASYPGMDDIKNASDEVGNNLDLALDRYQENPGIYSAPMVWLSFKGMSHAVVVIDRNSDGTYKILDPSGNYISTYKVCKNTPSWSDDKKNKVFETSYSSIKQYRREI